MDKLFFSVIVPTYRDRRLGLCLSALERQSFSSNKFEVIVVNNDSDRPISLEIGNYGKLNLKVLNEPIPGSYAARNKGIIHALGEVLAFTDSDCIPDVDWLKNAYSYFVNDRSREIGILTGNVPLFFRDLNKLSSAEVYEKYTGFTFESYAKEGYCGAGNWFSYLKVMEEFGNFNPNLKSNGDTDLSYKISQKYKIIYSPDVFVMHPARYHVKDLVMRYRRLLGGVYKRRFYKRPIPYLGHIIEFCLRRIRFAAKKLVTVKPYESIRIFVVCMALIVGAWKEYFHLIKNGDPKR